MWFFEKRTNFMLGNRNLFPNNLIINHVSTCGQSHPPPIPEGTPQSQLLQPHQGQIGSGPTSACIMHDVLCRFSPLQFAGCSLSKIEITRRPRWELTEIVVENIRRLKISMEQLGLPIDIAILRESLSMPSRRRENTKGGQLIFHEAIFASLRHDQFI